LFASEVKGDQHELIVWAHHLGEVPFFCRWIIEKDCKDVIIHDSSGGSMRSDDIATAIEFLDVELHKLNKRKNNYITKA
jgi:hypothetical protein